MGGSAPAPVPEEGPALGATPASPQAAASSARIEVRRTVLLSEEQGQALADELAGLEVTRSSGSPEGRPLEERPARPRSGWEVCYDNAALALTLRGWWLSERDGAWRLRVPVYNLEGTAGVPLLRHEEVTAPEDILERVGLVQHAEALRKGTVKSVERLLAQAGVGPIARLRTDERVYRLHKAGGTGSAASTDGELEVTLRQVLFDVKYSENLAVAELLFERGNAARQALQVTLAEFRLAVRAGDGSEDMVRAAAVRREGAANDLAASLRARGFYRTVADQLVCPELALYLRLLRPQHWRALGRAGVVPVEPFQEEPEEPAEVLSPASGGPLIEELTE